MTKPYLIGCFLVLEGGEGWTASQFRERLSEFIYAVAPYSPHTGRELPGGFLVDIRSLVLKEGEDPILAHASIFTDWEDLTAHMHYGENDSDDEEAEEEPVSHGLH